MPNQEWEKIASAAINGFNRGAFPQQQPQQQQQQPYQPYQPQQGKNLLTAPTNPFTGFGTALGTYLRKRKQAPGPMQGPPAINPDGSLQDDNQDDE